MYIKHLVTVREKNDQLRRNDGNKQKNRDKDNDRNDRTDSGAGDPAHLNSANTCSAKDVIAVSMVSQQKGKHEKRRRSNMDNCIFYRGCRGIFCIQATNETIHWIITPEDIPTMKAPKRDIHKS